MSWLVESFLDEKAESSHKRIEKLADKAYDIEHGFYPNTSAKKKGYDPSIKTYDGKPVPTRFRHDIAGRSARMHDYVNDFDSAKDKKRKEKIFQNNRAEERQMRDMDTSYANKHFGVKHSTNESVEDIMIGELFD